MPFYFVNLSKTLPFFTKNIFMFIYRFWIPSPKKRALVCVSKKKKLFFVFLSKKLFFCSNFVHVFDFFSFFSVFLCLIPFFEPLFYFLTFSLPSLAFFFPFSYFFLSFFLPFLSDGISSYSMSPR